MRLIGVWFAWYVDRRWPWLARPTWRVGEIEPRYADNAVEMVVALEYGLEL